MSIVAAFCVLTDARHLTARGGRIGSQSPGSWAVCALLVWVLAVPWYLVRRHQFSRAGASLPDRVLQGPLD